MNEGFLPILFVFEDLVHIGLRSGDVERVRVNQMAKVDAVRHVHEHVEVPEALTESHVSVHVRSVVSELTSVVFS